MRLTATFLFSILTIFQYSFGNEFYTLEPSNPLYETWRWKNFPELSNKGIRCMEEGHAHSVWFGTAKGLYYYDGLSWTRYLEENEILSAPIYGLCYTKSDELYVVSAKGIAHLDKNKWYTDLIFPETGIFGSEWEILNIIETHNKEIWVGLYFGLIKIVKNDVSLYTTEQQIQGKESYFKKTTINYLTGVFSETEPFIVFDLLEDKNSDLWLGLEDGRVLHLRDKNHDLTKPSNYTLYGEEDNMLISRLPVLYETREGLIYCISQSIRGGINTFDSRTGNWSSFALSDQFGGDNLNFSICETPDKVLWVGSFSRLFSYAQGVWTEFKQPEVQIPPTRIIIKPASDGSLWVIGHLSDVARIEYSTPQWQTYKDLLFQCESTDGNYWFINGAGEVISYDPRTEYWKKLTTEFPLSDPVRIFKDKSSCLWAIGSHMGAAALAWNIDGIWQMKTFPEVCWGFNPNGVYQTRDNSIWFGAHADCGDAGWGIIRFRPEKGYGSGNESWEYYKGDEVCEVAYALCETDNNTLLCGYYKGLFEFDGKQRRDLHQKLLGDIIKIECMIPDPEKGVWIGTRSQGVIHYINDENWTQYTVEEGLVSNSISSLMISDDSSLWVATDKGISLFDRKKWTRLALPPYFKISRGNGTLEKGPDNSIWINISSIEWYRRVFYNKSFTPAESPNISYQIKPEKFAPETRITSYDKKVHYPGNSMIFWEGVDQWNATNPEELQFSYRLDDEPWSDFSLERNHNFLSMRRGKHTLEVRARDNFMNIDLSPAKAGFRVIPPLWGRVWFILLILGVIVTIAYLLVSSMRKNREMEEQNKLMKENNDNLIKQQAEIESKGKQIMELLEKERENQWMNEGILLINDVIKQNRDNLKTLSGEILDKLIRYLVVSSGALLLYQEDSTGREDSYLELQAAYAINKERLTHKKIHPNEGLVGACFKEKRTMVIDNVPDSYYLESGLGHTHYTELVLVPLKMHDSVVGILEVSSLNKIEAKKIELLELVSENIASNIISLQSAEKISEMYRLSQEQTARLHEQEEELRQQMEELHATQEESHRREMDLQKELDECKKNNILQKSRKK